MTGCRAMLGPHLAPAHRAVAVEDVGPRPAAGHLQRVAGLVNVEAPGVIQ